MALGRQAGIDFVAFVLRNDGTSTTFLGELGSGVLPSVVAGDMYVALHNADPREGTQETSEVSWATYQRQPVSREMLSWNQTSEGLVINVDVDFGVNSDPAPVEITHFSIGTQQTGTGHVFMTGPMSQEISRPFTVDNSLSGNKLVIPQHLFLVGNQVQFIEDIGSGLLPSGLNSSGYWWVVDADPDGIRISATQGGGALPLSDGSGRCALSSILTIATGNSITFPSGSLTAVIG